MSRRNGRPAKVVYVGPTITGVAARNTVYCGLPEELARAIRAAPYLAGLCVPIPRLAGALGQIARKRGRVYTLYQRALADSADIQRGAMEHGI